MEARRGRGNQAEVGSVMDELIAFLEARLAEDEAAARACADYDGHLAWWDSRVAASGDHTIRTQGSRVIARIGETMLRATLAAC